MSMPHRARGHTSGNNCTSSGENLLYGTCLWQFGHVRTTSVRLPPPKASRNLCEKLCLPRPLLQCAKSTCLHVSLQATVCLPHEKYTLRETRRPPSVQVFTDNSIVPGVKRLSLFFLVILRDRVSAEIGHYGGPSVFGGYGVDEFC
jgi:hypothetical protein